jgi:Transglycosylase SLT domain
MSRLRRESTTALSYFERLTYLILCIAIRSPGQSLHTHPSWPPDGEFIKVNQAVEAACKDHPAVDEELVWGLIWEESKYDPLALGTKGEVGLGQLMPATARALGVKDRTDVDESVGATVGHLAYLLKKYNHRIPLVLGAYNAGEPAVDRCHCVPSQSRAYVSRIEQNRVFAKRIVQYVHESVQPGAAQATRIASLEATLRRLEAERQQATDVSSPKYTRLAQELQDAHSELNAALNESENLRRERDRLLAQLQHENSVGTQALALTQSLRERLDTVERRVESKQDDTRPGLEASVELEAIRSDLAELRNAVQNRSVQDAETRQRMDELSAVVTRVSEATTSRRSRVSASQPTGSSEPPLIALVVSGEEAGQPATASDLVGSVQDALLRKGLGVSIELQKPEFLARNLAPLMAGNGKCLRKVRAKQGRNWDYVLVLKAGSTPGENSFADTTALQVTVDSRLYTAKGSMLYMHAFTQTGAGFSRSQAKGLGYARLGKAVAEFLDSSIQ